MKKKSLFLTLITSSFLLPFMLFVVSPLSFYFSNINEVNFTLSDVWIPVLAILIVSSLIFFLLQILIVKIKFVYPIFSGLLLGFALCVWIQSQLMAWDFGPLDGRGVEWSRWSNHAAIECLVWFLMIAVCIYIALFKKKMMSGLMIFCLIIGTGSCMLSYSTAPSKTIDRTKSNIKMDDALRFHPKNNVIIILLDGFQSDYFELIAKEYPQEVNFLKGFTFYRNTISQYPLTKPNIPAIMTGQFYENLEPFKDYEKKSSNKFSLLRHYEDKGFSSKYIPNGIFSPILQKYSFSIVPWWSYFIDYGVFRSFPIVLKKHVYNKGQWFISYHLRGQYPPDFHGRDVQFLELFEKEASIEANNNGCFRFFHFYIPHLPLIVNENLRYEPNLYRDGVEGYKRQARGALKLARRVIENLHALGIYDSAEVVIMSDHGVWGFPAVSKTTRTHLTAVSERIYSTSFALLLHKKPNATGPVKINDAPLYNHELKSLLGASLSIEFNSAMHGQERSRRFLFYDGWKNELWGSDYLPPMIEYFVEGHAYDGSSWRRGKFKFDSGVKTKIFSGTFILGSGQTIKFIAGGVSDSVIRGDWSAQELNHRWTDGHQAGLSFRMQDRTDKNLLLRIDALAYLGGGLPHQTIDVAVNGQKTATWQMKGGWEWYEAAIPSNLVGKDGLLEVLFNISNPTSPVEVGESKDSRKLGMAVRELMIVEKGKR